MLGFAEELEYIDGLADADLEEPGRASGGRKGVLAMMLRALRATCDFYIGNTASDGIPYWDTGAPGLARMGDWRQRPADPFNPHEPVDSSAAAIACQGLLRAGAYLERRGGSDAEDGRRYSAAGLQVLSRLLEEPYLSTADGHQGLLLHSVYHRPNGWDFVPAGKSVPCGESSQWGDYHLREAALWALRSARGEEPPAFFRGKERA
jgi:unsaturated chondroitin disaccharide hydrolase